MEIVVLLKQVPDTEAMVMIADDGKSIKTSDLKWVINPYDEFAVEEALRIREAQDGKVTIVSVGTDKAVEAIRTALAMGADEGILINDPAAAGSDGLGTATFNLPAGSGVTGLTMHYAYALNSPWDFVSNPVAIEVVP